MNGPTSSPTLLQVEELAWIPPGAKEALWEGVSFSLEKGELWSLQGESGSGKSTLLRCIVALEPLERGQIRWRGEEISKEKIRLFRNRVLYVHQAPVAIAPTVEENLAFPRHIAGKLNLSARTLAKEEQLDLLARLGLPSLDVSRRFESFSQGEQQRITLVRALTLQPEILLLDEPTASLDEKSARIVEEIIRDYLNGDGAALWISHQKEQLKRLDARPLDIDQWRRRF